MDIWLGLMSDFYTKQGNRTSAAQQEAEKMYETWWNFHFQWNKETEKLFENVILIKLSLLLSDKQGAKSVV